MNSTKPLRMGMKYGAMKAKKGMSHNMSNPAERVSLGGCMHCGNMEHKGCMCHMLGGAKRKKKVDNIPNYIKNSQVMEGEGWLEDAFDWTTDKLVDIGAKAIGSYLPIPENLAKTGLKALQKGIKKPVVGVIERKLQGKGRPMSQKQQEYQQALELIKKKHNLNNKQAMIKYKEMKSKIK
jgi:hypothetical protein